MDRDPFTDAAWLDRAVASTRAADLAGEVIPLVRPRFIAGLSRQRPSLSVQLRVARRNGRLVLGASDAYCLLDPPAGTPAESGRLITWIDENWPLAVALALTVLLWAVALLIALGAALVGVRPLPVGLAVPILALVIAGLLAYLIFVFVYFVRVVVEMFRSFGDRRHRDRILAHHWSVRLLHATDPRHLDELFDQVAQRIGGKVLLVELSRVTTTEAREALCRRADVYPVGRGDGSRTILAVGVGARLAGLQSRRGMLARGLALLAVAVVAGLLVTAWQVAAVEHEKCARVSAAACIERPARWGEALYWLTGRLLSFDADGFKAATWEARLLGLSWTLFGLVILGTGLSLLFQEALDRNRTAGVEIVEQFNAAREAEERAAQEPGSGPDPESGSGPRQAVPRVAPGHPENRRIAGSGALWFLAGLAVGALVRRRSAAQRHRPKG